jgi:hypothetical protein
LGDGAAGTVRLRSEIPKPAQSAELKRGWAAGPSMGFQVLHVQRSARRTTIFREYLAADMAATHWMIGLSATCTHRTQTEHEGLVAKGAPTLHMLAIPPVRKHRPMFATEQTIYPPSHTLNTCHGRRGGTGRRWSKDVSAGTTRGARMPRFAP